MCLLIKELIIIPVSNNIMLNEETQNRVSIVATIETRFCVSTELVGNTTSRN